MKNIYLSTIGFIALAFALSLNYRYAQNDYGILDNTLSVHIFAQGAGSGAGSGADSGADSGAGASSDNPWYLWPIQGLTKDECPKTVDCEWSYEFNFGVFKWGEKGKGTKQICEDGGTENCSVGECL